MREFMPDYTNLVDAAYNRTPKRIPLYEHNISTKVMAEIMNQPFISPWSKKEQDMMAFFTQYCAFFRQMGYDTVSYELSIGSALEGSGALGSHKDGVIKTMEDYNRYPWEQTVDRFFELHSPLFSALGRALPPGMKVVGGAGLGLFECVQDIVGYMDLCYISSDDPELYGLLFVRMGDIMLKIWDRLLREFGELFCVCRFGDDLGYKSGTLLAPQDIKAHIIPQYKKIVGKIKSYNKPFLFHSCGCIFDIMEDMISTVGINAKHSNEDAIAPFILWAKRYGDRIGNFGGIDTDILCRFSPEQIRSRTHQVMDEMIGMGGFAIGSGNSIPDYVPVSGYLAMVEAVREKRGDY